MNNLKKIGLSALAGSLVAFSANAVEMSVSGTAEATYTTSGGTTDVSGNPMGANTSVKFSGSGDVGFGDMTIVRTLNDGIATALSAYMTLDMGSMGKLSLDSIGGDLEGLGPHDDNLPTAYEEVWTGVSSSGVTGAASNDTIGYRNTFAGLTVSLAHSGGGTAGTGDGSSEGAGVTATTSDYHLKYAVPMIEGLTLQYGKSTTDFSEAGAKDDVDQVGHILYSTGPVSVGYRYATFEDGTDDANGNEMEAYAIAFNVNDEFSVSFATQDKLYDVASGTDVTETSDAINASYTMGAMTLGVSMYETDNPEGATGKYEETELSVSFAF